MRPGEVESAGMFVAAGAAQVDFSKRQVEITPETLKKLADEYVIPGVMAEITKRLLDDIETCVTRQIREYFQAEQPGLAAGRGNELIQREVKFAAVKAVRKAGEDILRMVQRNAEIAAMAENQAKKGIR